MPSSRPRQDEETRRFMGSIYSHRYYRKYVARHLPVLLSDSPRNREERNRKTRERMARLRAQDPTLPPEILAVRLEARREAARKYRERCVDLLSQSGPICFIVAQESPPDCNQSARGSGESGRGAASGQVSPTRRSSRVMRSSLHSGNVPGAKLWVVVKSTKVLVVLFVLSCFVYVLSRFCLFLLFCCSNEPSLISIKATSNYTLTLRLCEF